MKAENKGQRVRGCVLAGNRRTGIMSKNNTECAVAYTHWYRHDDNLENLERELKRLSDLYMSFNKTDSVSISYEYAEYERL